MANRKKWEIEERKKKLKILISILAGLILISGAVLDLNFIKTRN